VDHVFSAALSARNLNLVDQMGQETVITPCPSCLTNLKVATHRMEDGQFCSEVNKLLDDPCRNAVAVKSVLQILVEDVGLEAIRQKVTKPLSGLKVAPYYGCIMNRPPEIMDFDDPENPTAMDTILDALGAEVVPFPLKVECCGASYGVARKDIVMQLSGRLLDLAWRNGADAMVVACPLCQMNLDLRQGQINSALGRDFRLPVFYFTQLMGLALSIDRTSLGLGRLNVNPDRALHRAEERQQERERQRLEKEKEKQRKKAKKEASAA
jgi:heterodisulfide reductase subunit B